MRKQNERWRRSTNVTKMSSRSIPQLITQRTGMTWKTQVFLTSYLQTYLFMYIEYAETKLVDIQKGSKEWKQVQKAMLSKVCERYPNFLH